jgi:hypothetical protein
MYDSALCNIATPHNHAAQRKIDSPLGGVGKKNF